MEKLLENVWMGRFRSTVLRADIGRNVTCLQLSDGRVVVHSTAPFLEEDIAAINALGEVSLIVEATGFHDTFLASGGSAFPRARILVPAPLASEGREVLDAARFAEETGGEIEAMKLDGIPAADEHLFYLPVSRTLVVADLVFNLGSLATGWTGVLMKTVSSVGKTPAMSRLYKSMIRDQSAFQTSLKKALEWDFERIIVGHGDVIEGREAFEDVLEPVLSRG